MLARLLSSASRSAVQARRCFSSSPGYSKLTEEDVAHFRSILETAACVQDPQALQAHNRDWTGAWQGKSQLCLKPQTTQQVSDILNYANQRKLAIVPQGGNTGLVGGSIPVDDEIVLSLSRANNVISFDQTSGALVAQAGCILQKLDDHVAPHGFLMPLDLGAKGSCQIGGNVSTNAGGLRLLRYGSLHGSVLGLEVVLANGQVVDMLRTLRKDNTGIDLKHLFLGSEGTLGVVTAVSIQCAPRPTSVQVVFLGLESFEAVLSVMQKARSELGEILSAFEYLDADCMRLTTGHGIANPLGSEVLPFYALIETHGSNAAHDKEKLDAFLERIMTEGQAIDGTVAQSLAQANQIWRCREGIPEALPNLGAVYKYDVSLPVHMIHRLVQEVNEELARWWPFARAISFGHVGDGNLHCIIIAPTPDKEKKAQIDRFVYERVAAAKGSISAEHGLGQLKAHAIHYTQSEPAVELMRSLKGLLDPRNILNPYKMLP